jgi:hypothetical protein
MQSVPARRVRIGTADRLRSADAARRGPQCGGHVVGSQEWTMKCMVICFEGPRPDRCNPRPDRRSQSRAIAEGEKSVR